ncbi:DEAD/DEAH box helicase [candidate division KSB1 bacterium]|nr:DEAD/DEAH box helicase [candidate division KSB1 bacterium]
MPSFDIFELHRNVMQDYENFVQSFIKIKNDSISQKVQNEINSGKFWPEPLIQFNPSFQIETALGALCQPQGFLHPALELIFQGYTLYKHQVKALELGIAGQDFVLTSGTGSGKSLTYIGTIFHHLLTQPTRPGIKAVIVYPMNALINSQTGEFEKFKNNYEKHTASQFPISFAQYTGQEKQDERNRILAELPDIILTNYMMLELILTRSRESVLRDSIFQELRYLVFDEMHTYRGRQGADVALLIRRIKAQCQKPITCIGTSATMVSGGSVNEQKDQVAQVACMLFGSDFTRDQVIIEYLQRYFPNKKPHDTSKLFAALQQQVDCNASKQALVDHPFSQWLENRVALRESEGFLMRNAPLSLGEIVALLAEESGLDKPFLESFLRDYLKWLALINQDAADAKDAILPFRVHQFISQTGSVFSSLHSDDENRIITLDPAHHKMVNDEKIPLYPMVFSRASGHEFLCVRLDMECMQIKPRDFQELTDEQEDSLLGYLIFGEDVWNPEEDSDLLPENWGKIDKQGKFKAASKYSTRLPQLVHYDRHGNFSFDEPKTYTGYFMAAKLLFDPTSGTIYHGSTSEATKLARLGSEGRSSSTTILAFSTIGQMSRLNFAESDQKILSFTDNRQDAALQAGHFNDFMLVAELRAAINKAVDQYGSLDFRTIDQAIFDALKLPFDAYSTNADPFPSVKRETDNALKDFLMYRVLYDLRYGWRVNLPNLEQCALLEIHYQYLSENCDDNPHWQDVPLIGQLDSKTRAKVVYQVLDYFRKSYAIHSEQWLTPRKIEEKYREIQAKLKDPWRFADHERIEEPCFMRIDPLQPSKKRAKTTSIGRNSALGRYLVRIGKQNNFVFKGDAYDGFIRRLLETLEKAGWLYSEASKNARDEQTHLYQLRLDRIIWKSGDHRTIIPDHVRSRSYREVAQSPNLFFQELYQNDFSKLKRVAGGEHTGQLQTEARQKAEKEFRAGELSALFCSPTMELGIDIADLNVVHMRNVPPNPSNYAQRSGRAGRSGQAALVVTSCSNFSPHDRHYFAHSRDMVAGVVDPPKIDLSNRELFEAHVHALFLAQIGMDELNFSLADLVDRADGQTSLRIAVREKLENGISNRHKVVKAFESILNNLGQTMVLPDWMNVNWVDSHVQGIVPRFERTLQRWIRLVEAAEKQLEEARRVIDGGLYKNHSQEMREALRNQQQAITQRALLLNPLQYGGTSEFYPYRYLASEGFLPGYNFTRLPIRTFVEIGDSGDYISRPRFIALSEFGPRNMIYYSGNRYQVRQILVQDLANNLTKAKVSTTCGYILMGEEYNNNVCPLTKIELSNDANRTIYTDLLELSDTRTRQDQRISCEEEERLRQGYEIQTFFSVPGGLETIRLAEVKDDDELLLRIRYIPAAKLVKINKRWKVTREEGFWVGLKSGLWTSQTQVEKQSNEEKHRRIKLYTTDTADALYLEPIKALGLNLAGVITLQYALKRAIEEVFKVESSEIGVELLGDPLHPNIFVYEAAEGSLGVLSRFMDHLSVFRDIVKTAYEICRFDDPNYKELASYDDLLSYYNQPHHDVIDRFSIKEALLLLQSCRIELKNSATGPSYQEQYERLLQTYDQTSVTERKFLDELYKRGLRLPDATQVRTDDIYSQPDFVYRPDIYIFCDGTPHDDPETKKRDQRIRDALRAKGFQVLVYYYRDNLQEFFDNRPDIFKKVC